MISFRVKVVSVESYRPDYLNAYVAAGVPGGIIQFADPTGRCMKTIAIFIGMLALKVTCSWKYSF